VQFFHRLGLFLMAKSRLSRFGIGKKMKLRTASGAKLGTPARQKPACTSVPTEAMSRGSALQPGAQPGQTGHQARPTGAQASPTGPQAGPSGNKVGRTDSQAGISGNQARTSAVYRGGFVSRRWFGHAVFLWEDIQCCFQ
jgi:hypothetical protein